MAAEYAFWVRGRICPDTLAALHPLHPTALGPRTELRGVIRDRTELYAVIARLDDLGLRLIALQRVLDDRPAVRAAAP